LPSTGNSLGLRVFASSGSALQLAHEIRHFSLTTFAYVCYDLRHPASYVLASKQG